MWTNLNDAALAMTRDGWKRHTAYWWYKPVSGRKVWVELEWDDRHERLMPRYHGEDEE